MVEPFASQCLTTSIIVYRSHFKKGLVYRKLLLNMVLLVIVLFEVTHLDIKNGASYYELGHTKENDIKVVPNYKIWNPELQGLCVMHSCTKKTLQIVKAQVYDQHGLKRWCGDIMMQLKGQFVYGRKDPYSSRSLEDFFVGDKIEIVESCPGNTIKQFTILRATVSLKNV